MFLHISKLKSELCEFLDAHPHWRKNAIAFTKRYIDEGLRDRAITRALDLGIDVPKTGYEAKKIYIWAENVLRYLSATAVLCEERGMDFREIFGLEGRHSYVHGKDNIPFHTIILPALLLADAWRKSKGVPYGMRWRKFLRRFASATLIMKSTSPGKQGLTI